MKVGSKQHSINAYIQRPSDENEHGLDENIESQLDWSWMFRGESCIRSAEADMELTLQETLFQTGTILGKLNKINTYARIIGKYGSFLG